MLGLAPLIVRNVWRNKRRSLLTLTSTAISLALLSLILAIYQGLFHKDDSSPSETMRLVVRHNVSLTQPLPESYRDKITDVQGVDHVTPFSWFQGEFMGDPNKFFARFAVDAKTVFLVHPDWEIAASQLKEFQETRTACVIAEHIAKQYGLKVGQTVTVKGDIYPVDLELKLVGTFKSPPAAECMIFHNEYLRELLPDSNPMKSTVGTYLILAKSREEVPDVARAIDDKFHNSSAPTRTESEQEFGRAFLAFLGNVQLFLMAICAAVTFTILLVSANTVAMSVRERTREVAILRTLGYRPGEIMQIILGEAIFIAILGGVVGLGMGWLVAFVMESFAASFGFQGVRWQSAVIVLATAVVVGVVSAFVPALLASRKNVVESLRFAG